MNQEKVGKFIRLLRNDKKMTQQELAESLGVSEKTIGNWENGRNMPDLALFKPLCEIFDITINELMSGERIDRESYQEKLEENMINLSIDNKNQIKRRLKLIIFVGVLVLLFVFLGIYLYNNIEIDVRYDSRIMKCDIEDGNLNYSIKGVSVLNTHYIERVIGSKKYMVFHSTLNLNNKKKSNFEYGDSLARLLNGNDNIFGMELNIDLDTKYVDVYYVNESLDNIDKLNDEDFLKRIRESYLMCSSD